MPKMQRTATGRKRRRSVVGASTKKSSTSMVSVPRNRMNFPQQMKTTLRYTERVEFSPTGTSVVQVQFRGNGMQDPYVGVGGHQPRGFDDFMAIYGKYTVLGSKCTAQFMYEAYDGPSLIAVAGNLTQNRGSSDNVPALTPVACGLHKGVEALTGGNYIQQMEKDRTQWGYITGTGGDICTLSGSGTTKEFAGKAFVVGSEGYTGDASTDPTEQWYWEVWAGRISDDYPQEKVKVVGSIILEYECVFTEPKTLSES